MKAIIDIPDELYRRVKAKTALLGRAVRDVTIELYQRRLSEPDIPPTAKDDAETDWVDALRKYQIPANTPGPTAREILEEGCNRLEPKATW